jgi:hypothetical protein
MLSIKQLTTLCESSPETPQSFALGYISHAQRKMACFAFRQKRIKIKKLRRRMPALLHQRNPITLISKVHTLLIQTFSLPSTPSTFSKSTPSHQHLRAGFLQNKSSFCAIPTALEPISLARMSVRNRARARLHITALLGSFAR